MNDVSGTARELPGLQGFEDDVEDDLGVLLPRRSPSKPAAQPAAGGAAEPDVSTPPPPKAATGNSTRSPGRRSKRKKADPDQAEPGTKEPENKIRSSVVHVPVPLHQQLVAYREDHRLSNGDIVIKAVAQAHPRLNELLPNPESSGGGIFQDRPSRAARTTAGPLTPLNVRLFEQDFTILDDMVEKFGAASRGHLVSVALSDFFSH